MISLHVDKETGYMSTEIEGNIETIIEEAVCVIDELCNITADSCGVNSAEEKIEISINIKKDITSLLIGLIGDTYTEWKKEQEEEPPLEFPT